MKNNNLIKNLSESNVKNIFEFNGNNTDYEIVTLQETIQLRINSTLLDIKDSVKDFLITLGLENKTLKSEIITVTNDILNDDIEYLIIPENIIKYKGYKISNLFTNEELLNLNKKNKDIDNLMNKKITEYIY